MKPIPQSKCDRAELLSRSHPLVVVSALTGIHPGMLSRLKGRGWRTKPYPKRKRPSDFAVQAAHLSHRKLMAHYSAGGPTVTRWLKELRG